MRKALIYCTRFAMTLIACLAMQPAMAQEKLFDNGNIYAVQNRPTQQAVVVFETPVIIEKIATYHWNNARGTSRAGTIAMQSETGDVYGPWQAKGQPGQGGVRNAYWIASPNVTLPAGIYTVIDSDPATWSQNAESGGVGMTWAEGRPQ
jgi:hypothetical protein